MKRYLMECIGTFLLTLAISLTGNPIAIGLMLMVLVYLGGRISGGHFNPAVSFIMFLEKKLSSHILLMYWLAQSIGAAIAICMFMAITNNIFIPEMVSGTSVVLAASIEALFTMVLCWVIIIMSTDFQYKESSIKGIIIGLTLMAVAFIGGLFNPAVATGSFVCNLVKNGVTTDISSAFVYMCGPLIGSVAASFLFNFFNSYE